MYLYIYIYLFFLCGVPIPWGHGVQISGPWWRGYGLAGGMGAIGPALERTEHVSDAQNDAAGKF